MSWLTDGELAQMRADVANLLPDTCSILSVSYVNDGEGGMTEAWGTVTADVACRIDYPSWQTMGHERPAGAVVRPYAHAIATMPYDTEIDTTNQVAVDDAVYAVTSVNNGQSWIVAVRVELERV